VIALALALAASAPVQIDGVRETRDSDRIHASGIVFRCALALDGPATPFEVALDGPLGGTGAGPMTLLPASAAMAKGYRSLPGSVSYDEKLPVGRRTLFVSLDNRLTLAGRKFFGQLAFTYSQDDLGGNRIYRSDRVTEAKLIVFKANQMTNNHGFYAPTSRQVRAVATVPCSAVQSATPTNGPTR
jgi:hypothetical protein